MLRNCKVKRAILNTDHGIVFVAKLVEIRIVYPNILGELELANEAGADHKGRNSALNAVPKRTFRQRRAVCRPAPDHPPSLNIRGGVTRVHPTNMQKVAKRTSVYILAD